MRYLHPISMNETFIASGIFHHRRAGGVLLTEESWTIHEFPDGAWMIRVDYDQREQVGPSVLVEAWRSPEVEGARIERFDISAFGAPGDTIKQARCTYSLIEDSIEIGRSLNGEDRRYETLKLPAGYVLYPGGWLFMGFAIHQLQQDRRLVSPVLMPRWNFTGNDAFLLEVLDWQIQSGSDAVLPVDGVSRSGRQITLETPVNVAGTFTGMIDAYGVILQGDNSAGHVALSRYARQQTMSN